jgi:hypothetical protein
VAPTFNSTDKSASLDAFIIYKLARDNDAAVITCRPFRARRAAGQKRSSVSLDPEVSLHSFIEINHGHVAIQPTRPGSLLGPWKGKPDAMTTVFVRWTPNAPRVHHTRFYIRYGDNNRFDLVTEEGSHAADGHQPPRL